jgi:hypothetical protein
MKCGNVAEQQALEVGCLPQCRLYASICNWVHDKTSLSTARAACDDGRFSDSCRLA